MFHVALLYILLMPVILTSIFLCIDLAVVKYWNRIPTSSKNKLKWIKILNVKHESVVWWLGPDCCIWYNIKFKDMISVKDNREARIIAHKVKVHPFEGVVTYSRVNYIQLDGSHPLVLSGSMQCGTEWGLFANSWQMEFGAGLECHLFQGPFWGILEVLYQVHYRGRGVRHISSIKMK